VSGSIVDLLESRIALMTYAVKQLLLTYDSYELDEGRRGGVSSYVSLWYPFDTNYKKITPFPMFAHGSLSRP
jgi:hypothetical protein